MKATQINVSVLREVFGSAAQVPNGQLKPTNVPHLRRCLQLGLVELVGPGRRPTTLKLTDAGRKAVAGEALGMRLEIDNRPTVYVADFATASSVYSAAREASGEGASTFAGGRLYDALTGKHVANVSYNGKVWGVGRGNLEAPAIFDPYAVVGGVA